MGTLRNHVQLIGNVGQEPNVTTLESGKKVARLPLATNEHYTDKVGEKQTNTHWHQIVAWGKLADRIEMDVFKGIRLAVVGKLTSRHYEDSNGTKRYVTEIIAKELLILDNNK